MGSAPVDKVFFVPLRAHQHDYKPKNLCFTYLSMTSCVRVEGLLTVLHS